MDLFAFTDLHGSYSLLKGIEERSKEADLLLSCGDLTVFGSELDKILGRLDALRKPVFVVHGNHESEEEMMEKSQELPNIYFIHRKVVDYHGVLIIGYGGGGFSRRFDDFHLLEKELNILPHHKTVFITHAPPYKTKLDRIHGSHGGNETVAEFIRKHRIHYHFSGHFHENEGKEDRIGISRLFNPGAKGMLITI